MKYYLFFVRRKKFFSSLNNIFVDTPSAQKKTCYGKKLMYSIYQLKFMVCQKNFW